MGEAERPHVCPVCHVIKPADCRNLQGRKIWPPHHALAETPGSDT